VLIGATALAAGCGAVGRVTANDGSAVAGKTVFKANCGGCHTLADAGTTGNVGPTLDAAFGSDKKQGFKERIFDRICAFVASSVTNLSADW
jgi:cytochrome c2